jgi:hypothetical protein
MPTPLDEVCCARVPTASLTALAAARCLASIEVIADGDSCWLRWDEANETILRLVLPLPGVELFLRRGGYWTQPGRRLPYPGPPENVPDSFSRTGQAAGDGLGSNRTVSPSTGSRRPAPTDLGPALLAACLGQLGRSGDDRAA